MKQRCTSEVYYESDPGNGWLRCVLEAGHEGGHEHDARGLGMVRGVDHGLLRGFVEKAFGMVLGDPVMNAAGNGLLADYMFRKGSDLALQAHQKRIAGLVAECKNDHQVSAAGKRVTIVHEPGWIAELPLDGFGGAENLAIWLLVALGQSERGMDDAVAVAKALLKEEDDCANGRPAAPAESKKT